MRLWQRSMIACARSSRMKAWAQHHRAGTALAARYVAGHDAAAAIERVTAMRRNGQRASLFYLGEYLADPAAVERNVLEKIAIARALGRAGFDVHVSVDPTQIGHSIDPRLARGNAVRIASSIAEAAEGVPGIHMLMLDMEDASVIDATIALHDHLRRASLPVGLTLQAYQKRTAQDILPLIRSGARVRLVRGAFAAGGSAIHTGLREVKKSYRTLIERMLSPEAREAGFRPSIATHDTSLHAHAAEAARRAGWSRNDYEFEMLLGVRADVADALAREGQPIRLYVPFGEDWWPHAARRIGENPRNGLLLARSMLGGKH